MNNTNLDTNINIVKNYTIEMIEKCQVALNLAVKSITTQDLELAKQVIKDDEEINNLRAKIRDKSIELLALKQPMAKDLRYVYSLAIISNELERIGDYAVNISKEAMHMKNTLHVKHFLEIPNMSKQCEEMLHLVKYSLNNEDCKLAREIVEKDSLVDELHAKIKNECIELMQKDNEYTNQGIQFLYITRHLERAADHVTNICENIIYIVEGQMVEIG